MLRMWPCTLRCWMKLITSLSKLLIIMWKLFFHKFILSNHKCQKINMKLFHFIYMYFIRVLNAWHLYLNNTNLWKYKFCMNTFIKLWLKKLWCPSLIILCKNKGHERPILVNTTEGLYTMSKSMCVFIYLFISCDIQWYLLDITQSCPI